MPRTNAPTDSLQARIAALRSRHAEVDAQIHAEQARPLPGMARLRLLKRRKLMLKDEMTYYEGVLRTLEAGLQVRAEQRA